MQATNSEPQKLIDQAEKLWGKLHKASKADARYLSPLGTIETAIAELYKLLEA